MKLLLVDDEPPARAKLRRVVAALPFVSGVVEACDAEEALALVAQHQPDAAILDIQMPGRSGLELAVDLPGHMVCAFSTAFDEHAVKAFELNAVDYLLKPYTAERLQQTVQRLFDRLASSRRPQRGALVSALQQVQPVPAHWLVPQRGGGLVRLPLVQVEWVAAADNYIELHAPPACHLARNTLAEFLGHSSATGFVRVHRSHAVNAAHIIALTPMPHGEAELTLRSGHRLRVSRGHRRQLV